MTTGQPTDACAYLEVIKSVTSLLRRGDRSPTHTHSLSQARSRRDVPADGLRFLFLSVTDWTMTSKEWLSHYSNCSHSSSFIHRFCCQNRTRWGDGCVSVNFFHSVYRTLIILVKVLSLSQRCRCCKTSEINLCLLCVLWGFPFWDNWCLAQKQPCNICSKIKLNKGSCGYQIFRLGIMGYWYIYILYRIDI